MEITGRYDPRTAVDTINGAVIPYVDVTGVHRITPPKNADE